MCDRNHALDLAGPAPTVANYFLHLIIGHGQNDRPPEDKRWIIVVGHWYFPNPRTATDDRHGSACTDPGAPVLSQDEKLRHTVGGRKAGCRPIACESDLAIIFGR